MAELAWVRAQDAIRFPEGVAEATEQGRRDPEVSNHAWVNEATERVDLNVVQSGDGRLLEIQGTAEGAPFSREQLDVLLDLAQPGLETLMAAQREVLGDNKDNE